MQTKWKVYRVSGAFVAQTAYPEDAARLIDEVGDTVRYEHKLLVWTEGADGCAGESYDLAADVMRARLEAAINKATQ